MTEHTNNMEQGRLGAAREVAGQDAHEDTSADRVVLFSGPRLSIWPPWSGRGRSPHVVTSPRRGG